MPKITFIKDHKVIQGDGKGPHYKAGESHELELSYAEKYKRRGLAVDYVAPPPAPAAEKPKPAPEPVISEAIETEVERPTPAAPSDHSNRGGFKRR